MSNFISRIDAGLDNILAEATDNPRISKPSCKLSKEQIDEHFDKHYLGYLKALRKMKKKLKEASTVSANHNGSDFRSAMIDVAFDYNGVVLHELYFESLGHREMSDKMLDLIIKAFNSRKNFDKCLRAAMLAARGWVILGHDWKSDELMLNLVDSHDQYNMMLYPILAIDVWEHSYYIDFKSDKEKYVDLILGDIDWQAVEERARF